MRTFRRLLCATDFSEHAGIAARRAASLAARLGAGLELLHVLSEPALRTLLGLFPEAPGTEARVLENAQRLLDEEASRLRAMPGNPAVKTTLRKGRPDEEILAACLDADLLVLGAHGQNPLRDMIIGSTAERLLRKVSCPALVSRGDPELPYRHALVPIDFSEHSKHAMQAATLIAPEAGLTALHALDLPFEGKLWFAGVPEEEINRFRAQARAQALRRMLALGAELGEAGQRFRTQVLQGSAAGSILETAERLGADLIVMGRRGKSVTENLFIGSVTRHILADATCDVLIIPA